MSIKSIKAHADLADGALIVYEARNRLRGAVDRFRAKHKVATAEEVAKAFEGASECEAICDTLARLEAALASIDKIADTLPENDLSSDGLV